MTTINATLWVKDRFVWNGNVNIARPDHPLWSWPLHWPGLQEPKLGVGQPSLIFVNEMSDACHEDIPTAVIKYANAIIGASPHIGLLPTRRCERMAALFSTVTAEERRLWQPKLWLGFSAEGQREFDERWPYMRGLAENGWFVFASCAPLIEPITLPPDFLALAKWCIASGEQGPHKRCRDLHPDWARAIRDQCTAANVAFYMKQMSKLGPIPLDLQVREFPKPCDQTNN